LGRIGRSPPFIGLAEAAPPAFHPVKYFTGNLHVIGERTGWCIMADQTAVQDAWSEIAPGYDAHVTPSNMALAEAALQRAGLRPDMAVLDVAAGSGGLGIPAARAGAEVVATDIAPAMVARLDRRAQDEKLSTLQARVMDGHALAFDDDTFDIVASQFGVMLFPDLPRGLREMARVTKPGGRVLLITLGPPQSVEFLGFFIDAAKTAVPGFTGLPMDPPPLPFQLSDPDRLREKLADAGLTEIRVETANHRLEFESGPELWDWVTASNPIGAELVAEFTTEQKTAAQRALDDRLSERSGRSGPAVLNNTVNIGIGTK
jgi:ubiquinone/menaquinone biosynthesis C-methylase UbiE